MSEDASRLLAAMAIVTGLLFVGVAAPVAAMHWSGSGAFGPTSAYQGVTTTFTLQLNNQATGTLDVYWVTVHFCWQPTNYAYYFKANDGSSVSIAGSGSRQFTGNVAVDQSTLGSCVITIQVNGQAVGDFFPETATYSEAITVLQVPPLQVSVSANPNNGQSPIAVTFTSTVTGGIPPYTYAWTFGDGGTSTDANPAYTYRSSGTYTVTLVVTDSMSTQKSSTATVTVTPPGFGGGVVSGVGILVLGVIGIVIAVVLVAVIIALRRRKPQMPPPGAQPPMSPPPSWPPR